MQAFNYHRPNSVEEAATLFSKASDARYLAGGQTLIPTLKMRLTATSDLIDLGGVKELAGIQAEAGKIIVGAMTTHAEVANSGAVQRALPALAALANDIGDRQVRNRGTLGGSLANNDPAACYPAAVLGLGATLRTSKREIAADRFFLGLYETALEPGEIITSVVFPIPKRAAYVKFRNPASRFALVGVFVSAASAGSARCTAPEFATSAWVVIAPTIIFPASAWMPASSFTPPRSIRSLVAASRILSVGISVCPPAR